MIKKLQRRFIRIALIALAAAMVLVVGIVNAANWISVRNEMNETLSFLADNSAMNREDLTRRMADRDRHGRNLVSESSWFSAVYDADLVRVGMNLTGMAQPDEETASALAEQAIRSGRESGMVQDYLYQVRQGPFGGRIVFMLNGETKLTAVRTLALAKLGL